MLGTMSRLVSAPRVKRATQPHELSRRLRAVLRKSPRHGPAVLVTKCFLAHCNHGATRWGISHMIQTKRFAFVAIVLLASVAHSQATSVSPLDPAQISTVIPVAGGCGIGFHRGPYGGCVANRPVVVAPAVPVVVAPGGPVVVAPAAPVVVAPGAPVVVPACRRVCNAFRCWRAC